jgi:hypothetical protein
MAEERTLPGWPRKKLVKDVRRQLSSYGIRSSRSLLLAGDLGLARRNRPVLLLRTLASGVRDCDTIYPARAGGIQNLGMLKLPYRANKVVPAEVAALLPSIENQPLMTAAIGPQDRKRTENRPARLRELTVALDGPIAPGR